jgi:hypothetical protein
MPIVRFDLLEGRTDQQIQSLLDAAHRAVVKAFDVPEDDRYQIVNEHKVSRLIVKDTGLGIARTRNVVVVSVTSRPRPEESKKIFYRELCLQLEEHCGIAPSDVVVSIVINSDADWSFGKGVAQFLTGEL